MARIHLPNPLDSRLQPPGEPRDDEFAVLSLGRERSPAACGKAAIERRPRKPGVFLPSMVTQRDDFFGVRGAPLPPSEQPVFLCPSAGKRGEIRRLRARPPGERVRGCPGGLCLRRRRTRKKKSLASLEGSGDVSAGLRIYLVPAGEGPSRAGRCGRVRGNSGRQEQKTGREKEKEKETEKEREKEKERGKRRRKGKEEEKEKKISKRRGIRRRKRRREKKNKGEENEEEEKKNKGDENK